MKRPWRRSAPAVRELEPRCLLSASGPSGAWLGQDGHDLVGPSTTPGPDGVPDIHILLSNLPGDRQVVKADVQGYGGGEWVYQGPYGPWAAALVRAPGAMAADLYLEPYQVETGRSFEVKLTYDDGTVADFFLSGGVADPTLRMPADALAAQWIGQDGHDLTGPGPGVGPDGFQDVHLALSRLDPHAPVQSLTITTSSGTKWEYGLNPDLANNGDLVVNANDPTRADLYFSPFGDLAGQALTLAVVYANGTTDRTTIVAGYADPALTMPVPTLAALDWNSFTVAWLGQDGQDWTGPGDVHLGLTGLPVGRAVVSATLNDEAKFAWYAGALTGTDASALPMVFRGGIDPTRADLDFPPVRDESNSTMTLVLVLDDGSTLVTRFAGGASDPGLRSPGIAPTRVSAVPGNDLNALANQYGTVHLSAGTYVLNQPLVLSHPVAVTADPGATLLFTQAAGDAPWTAAIKIESGHTTLDGFAVRFAGPVRWNESVSYGPAVIGTTDNLDSGTPALIEDVTISHLDMQSPPAASAWEAAPSLMRLVSAQSGTIADNVLKGGSTEFFGGPWQFVGNTDLGTVPGTYTSAVVAGHYTHDVTIADNQVRPTPDSGKTWRFLVLTQGGVGDLVRNNTVVGVGPMDNDTVPNPNATEVILTESYRLHFEGALSSVSPDGWVVQVPTPQGGPARTGDVLALLNGPQAGQWRTIAQALGSDTYLLDAPITPGTLIVSITQAGFVNETFQGNTIDLRGSSTASGLDLAGNLFGVQVRDNQWLGGGTGFVVAAYPTEQPDLWGWSHAPVLGLVVSGNTITDALRSGVLDVNHGAYIKSNQGRVYLSAALIDNTIAWSDGFLTRLAKVVPVALSVGNPLSLDPAELWLSEWGNQLQPPTNLAPAATIQVNSALVNGQPMTNRGLVLPAVAPAPPIGTVGQGVNFGPSPPGANQPPPTPGGSSPTTSGPAPRRGHGRLFHVRRAPHPTRARTFTPVRRHHRHA